MINTVIFDLDGTLVNSLEDLADTTNLLLKKRGYPIFELEQYRYFVGNGVAKLIERALPLEHKNEVKDINYRKTALKNIIEIEKWCKEQFEGKPEYSRRVPRTVRKGIAGTKEGEKETKEQREVRLGIS